MAPEQRRESSLADRLAVVAAALDEAARELTAVVGEIQQEQKEERHGEHRRRDGC